MTPPYDFQSATTRYAAQNAYWLARASELAYRRLEVTGAPEEASILAALQTWDGQFLQVKGFNGGTERKERTQAFIAQHEKIVIVAFRGTDEVSDWLDNISISLVPLSIGRVHRGFYRALQTVWSGMLETIDQFQDRGQSLWLTGHSLGGALATLAAVDLVEQDKPFYGVYTYGQPRCCDRVLARTFNVEAKNRFFRFQNNNDIVSRVPQRAMGYSHVGTFMYIDVNQKLHTDLHWWFQFTDRLSGTWDAIKRKANADPKINWVADHRIDHYINALALNMDFQLLP